ncbi:tyrosine-type recombinase/integrase [Chryseobacterium sp. 22532]|uniref:tyrosine-type recombinase/integrase n=1 Tax=Chryseobacterium sp. 22532 TaxID=3453938 RepID=UPI003F84E9E4
MKHKIQDNRKLLNITAVRIYEEFKKLLKKTELNNKGFTLHCLRHTIATQLLEQGMELEKVPLATARLHRVADKTKPSQNARVFCVIMRLRFY